MDDELKQYLKNYLGDLRYWRGLDIESVNHYTNGTPTIKSKEQFAAYIKPLEDLLMDDDIRLEKSRIGSLQHWEEQFHKQGWVDDEHSAYIASVLATERRELERRVEAHEMKEHCAYIASVLAAERRELERRVEAHEMKEEDGTD